MIFEYKQPVPVLFGEGAVKHLGAKISEAGCKHALLVVDRSMKNSGIAEKAEASLTEHKISYVIFDDIVPDAPDYSVNEGGKLIQSGKFDAVAVVGGGSAIDTAKAIAALSDHPLPIEDYLTGPPEPIELSVPMFIAPTTSGTGSEVTKAAIISHTGINAKIPLFIKFKPGSYAIIDPELTVSAPPHVTALAGMDAFSHTIEAITARHRNPRSEILAAEAIRRICEHLPKTYANGADISARSNMAFASNIAGIAFADTDVQYGHALADSISAVCHTPHGLNCAWVTPEMIWLYAKDLTREIKVIGTAMGLTFAKNASYEDIALQISGEMRKLMRSIGIKSMSESGFSKETVISAAELAMNSPLKYNCPIDVTLEQTRRVLENAYENYTG